MFRQMSSYSWSLYFGCLGITNSGTEGFYSQVSESVRKYGTSSHPKDETETDATCRQYLYVFQEICLPFCNYNISCLWRAVVCVGFWNTQILYQVPFVCAWFAHWTFYSVQGEATWPLTYGIAAECCPLKILLKTFIDLKVNIDLQWYWVSHCMVCWWTQLLCGLCGACIISMWEPWDCGSESSRVFILGGKYCNITWQVQVDELLSFCHWNSYVEAATVYRAPVLCWSTVKDRGSSLEHACLYVS